VKRMPIRTLVAAVLVLAVAPVSVRADTWQAESLRSPVRTVEDPAAVGGQALAISDKDEEAFLLKDCVLPIPGPGKYVLELTIKVEHAGRLGTPIVCRIFQAGDEVAYAAWFGADFSADGRYQVMSLPFECRSAGPISITAGWRPAKNADYYLHQYLRIDGGKKPTISLSRGDLGHVFLDEVSVAAKNRSAGISALKCKKIHLRRGETQTCTVLVSNYTASPQELTLKLGAVTRINEVRPLRSWSLTLEPGASRALEHSWSVGQQEYGRQVQAVLMRGDEVLDSEEEYFGVSDNIWKLGNRARHRVYDPLVPAVNYIHWSGLCTPELIEKYFRQSVDGTYVNVMEKFSWAPDFFSDMTPQQETWRSGQGTYYESKSMLKLIIQKAHERGVKVTTYGYGVAGGPPAYEFARKHPEWVCYEPPSDRGLQGRLWQAVFNTRWFEDWPHLTPDDYYHVWPRIQFNFAHPEVLEVAIRELKGSIEMFGWDGVRFDSHAYYVWARRPDLSGKIVPSEEADLDELSAANVLRTKREVHADYPHFDFGYNWGPIYARRGARHPKNYAACLSDGGMRLNEQVIMAAQPDRPGHVWQEYADIYAKDASHAIKLGGHYWVMQLRRGGRMDVLYQAVLSLAARCHLYNSGLGPTAFGNLARFATRYSYYLWDPELEPVEEPHKLFSVEAERAPIWRPFVYRRKTPKGMEIVMHLVNRPPFEAIGENGDDQVPPVSHVRIGLLDSEAAGRIGTVTVLSPEEPARPREIEFKEGVVEVGDLRLWKVLVLDFEEL